MDSPQKNESTDFLEPDRAWPVLRAAGSVKLGVVLISVIAVVLICATLLEANFGMDFADWYIYKSTWFIVLLAVLGVNLLAATLVRFPWKNKGGFFLAHAGILVLLVGSIITFWFGIDEMLPLVEGEKADRLHLGKWCNFTVTGEVKPSVKSPPEVFSFQPGPFNWPDGKTFEWGESHRLKLKVLKYYAHASFDVLEDWTAANKKVGVPAIHFAVVSEAGEKMGERWLADVPLGGPGGPQIQILSAPLNSMREDFLNPPKPEEDPDGVLSVHVDGKMQRIPVSKNIGKKIALEGGKTEVEIVNYYANAKLHGMKFESQNDEPKNPILDLKIYLPGEKEPLREFAAAKIPLMSVAAMHGKQFPIRFWYHQPAYSSPPGIDFLRTPDGRLYCRTSRDGKYVSQGEDKKESSIEMGEGLRFKILDYLPFAKHKIALHPYDPKPGEKNPPGAAALVEVQSGGEKQAVWLVRGEPTYGSEVISFPNENIEVECGDKTLPLGFSLRLLEATAEMNPGRAGVAAYISRLQLKDQEKGIDEKREIRMNQPLRYGNFRFYQSGYNELPSGEKVSILEATSDPGRFLKYLGCWMICLGIALRYITRSPHFKTFLGYLFPSAIKTMPTVLILLLGVSSASAETADAGFNWNLWRSLPVQEDGRQKPFDTLARESMKAMANRTDFSDPETGQSLDAVAMYLSMLFDWQGWETSAPPPADSDLHSDYFRLHKPDKWDNAPLLYVDSWELREALGIAANQKFISPIDLQKAKITDPESSQTMSFFDWAERVVREKKDKPSNLETKGVELANRFQYYLADRMGQRLEIIPLKGDPHKRWVSLAMLMQADFDDQVDPQGVLRKAKELFRQARAAYRKADAKSFNEASTAVVAALKELGPTLGNYPSATKINLELSYNRWAPFRIAWILAFVALGCAVSSTVSNSKVMHFAAWLIFFASILAMLAGFTLRSVIAQRAPVTNMYESMLSVAVGIALLGWFYEAFNRKRYLLIAASALSALVILFAENCPSICNPSIRPLMAVLRTDWLLCIHVVPIMFSYSAFAVAWVLANVLLYGYLLGREGMDFMNDRSKLMLKIVRIGVFLLAVGTAIGAYWGDLSWGRFWGWDPKEVWALITLFCYLGILHARYVGWLGDFGTTAWTAISCVVVIMTYYGVNFVLGTGMHSYGSGSGGIGYYVLAGLIVQFVYLFAAIFFHYARDSANESAVKE